MLPVNHRDRDGHDTFIFQTLGYVEAQDGELQAIVADGPEVYLVKQGETFAEQYRATSVDPILVLAVKLPPGQRAGKFLSAQTNPATSLHRRMWTDICISPYSVGQAHKLRTR